MTAAPWSVLPPDLVAVAGPRLDGMVDAVAASVTASVPAFAGVDDPKLARDVRGGVRAAFERFLELAGTQDPPLTPALREAFAAIGAAEAREERGVEALVGALRVASRLLLRTATEALAASRPVPPSELLDLSDAVSVFVDALAAAATDGYAQQVRDLAGEGERRRRVLAEAILRGDAGAPLASAAAALGRPAPRTVVPVLLPPDRARDARFRYAADGVVLERGRDALLLLDGDSPRADRAALLASLRGRCVVGPRVDVAQVPRAVRLAEALAGTPTPSGPSGAVLVDDHLVALALRGEPEALVVLTQRRLAPFAAVPPSQRERLLATLHSWLRHWGSRADVAHELFVHPQTVSYRVRQARELVGDALDDPDVRFELLLVLSAR